MDRILRLGSGGLPGVGQVCGPRGAARRNTPQYTCSLLQIFPTRKLICGRCAKVQFANVFGRFAKNGFYLKVSGFQNDDLMNWTLLSPIIV